MAYYQGDYYQGDYYSGDPFLGKLWGGIKKIAKGALGMGGGGGGLGKEAMAEAVAAGIAQSKIAGAQTPIQAALTQPIQGAGLGAGGVAGLARAGGMAAGAFSVARRAFTGFDVMPGPGRLDPTAMLPGGRPFWTGAECGSGFHKAKDGSQRCVRNRRMNVTNPRALRRGLRRVAGFGKLAQRARRDIGRAATAVGAGGRRRGPVARHHAAIRRKA